MCRKKKEGKPKVLMLDASGSVAAANVVVTEGASQVPGCASEWISGGEILRRLWRETTLSTPTQEEPRPSPRLSSRLERQMDQTLCSDGTGKIMRVTSNGDRMPLDWGTLFSQNKSKPILSLWEIYATKVMCVCLTKTVSKHTKKKIFLSGNVFAPWRERVCQKLSILFLLKERRRDLPVLNAQTSTEMWVCLPESASDAGKSLHCSPKTYKKSDGE